MNSRAMVIEPMPHDGLKVEVHLGKVPKVIQAFGES